MQVKVRLNLRFDVQIILSKRIKQGYAYAIYILSIRSKNDCRDYYDEP